MRITRRKGLGVAVLAALGLAVAWYGVAWVRHTAPAGPFQAIAHRGGPGSANAPEGTLAAFSASVAAGADWLEFDVHATRDGVLVVLHDDTVDRTTNGTGAVADLTYAQVSALDAGGGARIPTVAEVVELAKAAGVPILPEVKDGPLYPSVTPALLDLLDQEGYLDHTMIQAFEPSEISRILSLRPAARTCLLTGLWQFDPTTVPTGTTAVCPMGEMVLLAPDMVRQAHAAGLLVFAWWGAAETGPTDAVLRAYGVDGLIVNDLSPLGR